MHQWGIHHEDVLMKMFMYSLEGDAREWYRSLPPASISSLEQFHVAFSKHCKRFFPADLLFENCCEEFGSHIRQSLISSSSSENKRDFSIEEVEEDSVTYESSSDPFIQKDDVGNYINDEIDDNKALDTSCIILGDSVSHCYDTSVVLCSHKYLINYEESDVEGHEQVFPLPSEIVEQQEIYKSEDDILELERGKTSNAEDIPIHFKQQDEKYQEYFVSLYGCESHDFHESFQRGQEQLSLVYNAYLTQQQLCPLNQLEAFHEFQDPIARWMDSYFSKIPKVESFSMIIICNCKYQMPANFLSHLIYPLWIILNSDMHRVMVLSQMFSWFHWKWNYT
jgi:hypothetical protein